MSKDKTPDCDSIQYIGDITSATDRPRQFLSDKYKVIEKGYMHNECKYWKPLIPV